jgi:pimeloyl-ACP methyl ester carboxylesterase
VHEPQVARRPLPLAALALLLVAPLLLRAGWTSVLSAAFLLEFLSAGRVPALTAITPEPARAPLPVPGVAADLYRGAECAASVVGDLAATSGGSAGPPRHDHREAPGGWPGRACSLVLVHGLAPAGKDDPRLTRAARLLARTGAAVAVPTVPGLTRLRLGVDDVEAVVATIASMPAPVRVVGISVGAGPALLAAADPRVRERVTVVLSLGGYASARELARFYVTAHPDLARRFADANPDLMDATARQALATGNLEPLSPELRRRLDALSPARVVGQLRARLLIVHGRDDPAVPFTESLRLAEAARALGPHVVIVGAIGHVEAGARQRLRDLLALWRITRELLADQAR